MSQTKAQLVEGLNINSSTPADSLVIDSSGNILVGKTASSGLTAGCELRPAGMGLFTRASANPLQVRRLTDDGDLIEFYQDSGLIGSIGVQGTSLTVGMAGPERLRIDSSGNVKIGASTTIAPDSNADDFVIDKGAADTGLSILSISFCGVGVVI